MPKILASPAYKKDGLLIVTFAATNPPSGEVPPPADPLKVGTLLLSRYVAPGGDRRCSLHAIFAVAVNRGALRLEPLGLAASAKTKSFAPHLLGSDETAGD